MNKYVLAGIKPIITMVIYVLLVEIWRFAISFVFGVNYDVWDLQYSIIKDGLSPFTSLFVGVCYGVRENWLDLLITIIFFIIVCFVCIIFYLVFFVRIPISIEHIEYIPEEGSINEVLNDES